MMVMEVENLNAPRPKRLLVLVMPVLSFVAFRVVTVLSRFLFGHRYEILAVVGDVGLVFFLMMTAYALLLKRPDAY